MKIAPHFFADYESIFYFQEVLAASYSNVSLFLVF